jgi:mannose-6-phosphate isomerase-like protein (cupin superfamily)
MFSENIKELSLENTNFRKVLHTGKNSQVVAMCIPPGTDIGEEVHPDTDQILVFVQGTCDAILNGETKQATIDDLVFVPAGTTHNFINTGTEDLKLYTVYAPPEHADGTIHKTKADAANEE